MGFAPLSFAKRPLGKATFVEYYDRISTTATQPMAYKRNDSGWIEGRAAGALVSPVRQEIVDTIEALGGDSAVADIAAHLGRPADGIYYHLRRLVDGGVLRESDDPGDGRGRRYSTVAPRGKRVRLKYGHGSHANRATVSKVVAGMLRTAERDFSEALKGGDAVGEGPLRDLWASRLKGWVGDADLREINRLLARLSELLLQPRGAGRDRLVTLAWMLAPIDDKPLRRDGVRAGARKPRTGTG
jgi:DNA-binding transcriptional ArsR family regulator